MIEFSVMAPILAVVAFAGVEFGLLFAHAHTVNLAARSAVRMASATAAAPTDDYDILRAVRVGGKSIGEGNIDKVVIFKADDASGSVPPDCLTGSVAGICDVYSGGQLQASSTQISSLETAWPPSERQPGLDYVGIYVTSKHKWLTGLFGPARTVSDSAVMRLEPAGSVDPSVASNTQNGSVSFAPAAPAASGHHSAHSQYDVPGFTPAAAPDPTPGIVPGFTPGTAHGSKAGSVGSYTGGSHGGTWSSSTPTTAGGSAHGGGSTSGSGSSGSPKTSPPVTSSPKTPPKSTPPAPSPKAPASSGGGGGSTGAASPPKPPKPSPPAPAASGGF